MIHWMWAVIALAVGAIGGLFMAAMLDVNRDEDTEEEYGEDDL